MATGLAIGRGQIDDLTCHQHQVLRGNSLGSGFEARLEIPDYVQHIDTYYGVDPTRLPVPLGFKHFGFVCQFDETVELPAFDAGRRLDDTIRLLVARFGAVVFRNAILPAPARQAGQRNIFPDKRFHYDRTETQGDVYSCFYRDPYDPDHQVPRKSSTLILANSVAYLEATRQNSWCGKIQPWYDFFVDKDVSSIANRIVFEQPWRAPTGTGELVFIDNREVLHASYYRSGKGYPIGVHYLF